MFDLCFPFLQPPSGWIPSSSWCCSIPTLPDSQTAASWSASCRRTAGKNVERAKTWRPSGLPSTRWVTVKKKIFFLSRQKFRLLLWERCSLITLRQHLQGACYSSSSVLDCELTDVVWKGPKMHSWRQPSWKCFNYLQVYFQDDTILIRNTDPWPLELLQT